MGNRRTDLGQRGEQLAAEHLARRDYLVLERNWRCEYGEIDIAATHGDTLVIVEVKTRQHRDANPAESVTAEKLVRLRRLTIAFMLTHEGRWANVRIDVIAVNLPMQGEPVIRHLVGVRA